MAQREDADADKGQPEDGDLTGCPEIFSRLLRTLNRLAIQVLNSNDWLSLLVARLTDNRSVLPIPPCNATQVAILLPAPVALLLCCRRLGILKARVLPCRRRQSPEHQTDRADAKHTFARIRADFIILTVAPVATYPSKGALDNPTNLQGLKAHGALGATANLQPPLAFAVLVQPRIEIMVVILVVSKEDGQPGQRLEL